jgi:predicted DCC family thiol-disulfide oxidoreductase YuxK
MGHFGNMDQNKTQIVIYFDGVCNLCNFFVDFVIRRDRNKIFLFAPLQGKTAQKNLGHLAKNLSTVVVKNPAGALLTESQAVLYVLSRLSFPWSVLSTLGRIFPRLLCDWIYRKVAAHRYFLFGQRQICRLPNPEELAQFLD